MSVRCFRLACPATSIFGSDGDYASTVTFLNWAAEPELDERKKMGFQALIILSTLTALSIWVKRIKWCVVKLTILDICLVLTTFCVSSQKQGKRQDPRHPYVPAIQLTVLSQADLPSHFQATTTPEHNPGHHHICGIDEFCTQRCAHSQKQSMQYYLFCYLTSLCVACLSRPAGSGRARTWCFSKRGMECLENFFLRRVPSCHST